MRESDSRVERKRRVFLTASCKDNGQLVEMVGTTGRLLFEMKMKTESNSWPVNREGFCLWGEEESLSHVSRI